MASAFGALSARADETRRITFRVEPTLAFCVGGVSCPHAGAFSFDAFYHIVKTARVTLRLQLGREYETSRNEDGASGEVDTTLGGWHRAAEIVDLRLRRFDESGALAASWHAGDRYVRATAFPYHSQRLSFDRYFGRRIARGNDGDAHQYDIQVNVSSNRYQSSSRATESFVALTPGVVLPLTASGAWRARIAYTAQARFAGADRLSPYSGRVVASITHDVDDALNLYLEFAATNRAGRSDAGVTAGLQYEF